MQNTQKGSIIVEAIVMIGLIATITPILYKHVADRRQDIENINEANTLLLLKNATAEYIEANKDTLTTRTLTPTDIGIDISGYQIGIRKDSSGNIDAMITGTGGNDLKAAKVASLLGLSAGIYSAQNTEKAWGINGVWAEDISNYGFSSLPTGIPVITTAYDKEASSGLNEEQLKDFIENTGFDKVTAQQFCLGEECITEWIEATETSLQLIINCNMGDQKSCKRAYQKGQINRNCEAIADTFEENEGNAQSGFYTFSLSESNYTQNNLCFFINNQAVNAEAIINGCNNDGNSEYCRLGYTYHLNQSCEEVILSYQTATSGWYNLTTSSGYTRTPCLFVNQNIATPAEAIGKCTSSGSFACIYGWYHEINRSCESIIFNNPSASTGFYFLTTGASGSGSSNPCVFPNTPADTISQCNAANNTNHAACRYGWNKAYNQSCEQVIRNYPSGANSNNTITSASSVSRQYCINCSTSRVIATNISSGTFEAPCSGTYGFTLNGVSRSSTDRVCSYTSNASRNSGSGIFSAGTKFTVQILPGEAAKYCTSYESGKGCKGYTTGSTGGNGIGVYNGTTLLIAAKGGNGMVGRPWCVQGGAGGSNTCNLSSCGTSQGISADKALASITFSP